MSAAIARGAEWAEVAARAPKFASMAEREARLLELGPDTAADARSLIGDAIRDSDQWILVGGPPCQAYSLVGRARNSGNASYRPEKDKRQTLYVEYLQILADHAPPAFIMENVKGLLSAKLKSQRLFERIVEDLGNPAAAIRREGRSTHRLNPRYDIHTLVQPAHLFAIDPTDYVVRSEQYGIPQRRHRIVLLGVRRDASVPSIQSLKQSSSRLTTTTALAGLPRLRSGISDRSDSADEWIAVLHRMKRCHWMEDVDRDVRNEVHDALDRARAPRANRGGEYLEAQPAPVLNHKTRGHIVEDLARYMFSSCFARVRGRSPRLDEFPSSILPLHKNVAKGIFSDRFRVQLGGEPSTTITSHISKDGHYYIHFDPTQCRSLTVREAARLQTFPDDYFFCGPRTSQYQQVGNAVPPRLAEQIASVVAGVIK